MDKDTLRAEITRALESAYPDRAAEMIRELEKRGTWNDGSYEPKTVEAIRQILDLRPNDALLPHFSTTWGEEHPAGNIAWGTEWTIGRYLENLPIGLFMQPRRIGNTTRLAILAMRLVHEGNPPLSPWMFRLRVNNVRYIESLDGETLARGIRLPLPILVDGTNGDDVLIDIRLPRREAYDTMFTAQNNYRLGLVVEGFETRPLFS